MMITQKYCNMGLAMVCFSSHMNALIPPYEVGTNLEGREEAGRIAL
jgi:hypothetical protein